MMVTRYGGEGRKTNLENNIEVFKFYELIKINKRQEWQSKEKRPKWKED